VEGSLRVKECSLEEDSLTSIVFIFEILVIVEGGIGDIIGGPQISILSLIFMSAKVL
jgi:hypothetical protein